VTTVDRSANAHQAKVDNGERRPVTTEEFEQFRKVFGPQVEDKLSSLTADLVSRKDYEWWIRDLFTNPPGRWIDVFGSLASSQEDLEDMTCYAAWLSFPMSSYGDGYRLIIFFSEQPHWSNVALYNAGRREKPG
jgi:hypothetical protein